MREAGLNVDEQEASLLIVCHHDNLVESQRHSRECGLVERLSGRRSVTIMMVLLLVDD